MAAISLVYIGGGSSRAPGTMASLISKGDQLAGSRVTLVDQDAAHLEVVRTLAEKMARAHGVELTVEATTDRLAALRDTDAVLTSFRPGGFEGRAIDERIPLSHGLIGQETQGAGGFFMALRSIQVMREICAELDEVAPRAVVFNYTNPVNLVSQAVTRFTGTTIYSMCEGLLTFPGSTLRAAGLDPARARVTMAGVNHNVWSWEHTYDGADLMPLLDEAWERVARSGQTQTVGARLLRLATIMRSVPSDYFQYYFYGPQVVAETRASGRTRAQTLIDAMPGYWDHYRELAAGDAPRELDPSRSRGGVHELEVALDVMSAYYNDTGARLPVNVPNATGALPGFDTDVVVETFARVDAAGVHPEPQQPLPHPVRGLVQQLAEYQYVAAEAAWHGTRRDAVRALAANPLVPSLDLAERVYDELAAAHAAHLPERLLR